MCMHLHMYQGCLFLTLTSSAVVFGLQMSTSSKLGRGRASSSMNRASTVLRTLSRKTQRQVHCHSWSRASPQTTCSSTSQHFWVLVKVRWWGKSTCFWLAYEFADWVAMNKQIPGKLLLVWKFMAQWVIVFQLANCSVNGPSPTTGAPRPEMLSHTPKPTPLGWGC